MKQLILILALALMLAVPVSAQVAVNVFTGLSFSAFEDQDESASALPLGVAVGFNPIPNLEVGGEVNLALPGYGFESTIYDVKITTTFQQNLVGAYGRFYFSGGPIMPFAKLGLGYYFGDVKVKGEFMGMKMDETLDVDGAVGFNVGAGVMLKKGFYGEFNYNILSRKSSDGEGGSDSYGANTWAIQLGYRFKF